MPRRCAIYTRKSSAEGLDRQVNSLDAQRHFCESFIASQSGEGWITLPVRYDDGGYSGGSLDRPAIHRLLADITEGAIDVVVVYKIDRLSRSLIDFAHLLGRFDLHSVSFVAVTQAFNTTSSMGRLTLNVLLSYAQFERELLSERLRDKFAAMRAEGLWQTGVRPFGYHVANGVLTVDDEEAKIIRYMHRRYPLVGSTRILAEELASQGHRNKAGGAFTACNVRRILHNRLYCGDLGHGAKLTPGKHSRIVSEERWRATQAAMALIAYRNRSFARPKVPNPLRKRIFGPDGELMSLDFVYNRQGRIYRYYLPSGRSRRRAYDNPGTRFRADVFDQAVLAAIVDHVPIAEREAAQANRSKHLKALVRRVDIGAEQMTIAIGSGAVVDIPIAGRVKSISKPRGRPPKPAEILLRLTGDDPL